ncbi:MAG: phosphomannomutase, partial [Synergistaceae bacterium]|nr:phosphomannomutase [Synergistaceae bacterium]
KIQEKAQAKHECSVIDGVRILYPDGWGLIRASNTQPVMVVRCEGKTEEALEKIMSEIKDLLLSEGLPDFTWAF